MNENARCLFAATLIVLFACAPCPVSALDLFEAYKMAASTSPVLDGARARLAADIAARRVARSALLPQLGARAGISYQDAKITGFGEDFSLPPIPGATGPVFGDIEETYAAETYSVTLIQPLVAGQAWSAVAAADARVSAARAAVTAAEQDLILQVVDAYFGVLNGRADLEVALTQKKLLREIRDQARSALKVGTGDIISLHEARARFDAAESGVIAARNRLRIARKQLGRLIHEPVGDLRDLETLEPRGPVPDRIDAWVETARKNRPLLTQAREQFNAALEQVEAARRVRWPGLDLDAAHGYSEGDFLPSVETRKSRIGLTLTLPIYQGGRINANLRQAKAEAAAVSYRLADLADLVDLGMETAYIHLQTSVARLRAAARAVESAETSYAGTKKGYEVGTRTVIDLLAAAQDLESVRRDYHASRYDHVRARVRLKWAAGILGVEDVAAMNGLLGSDS